MIYSLDDVIQLFYYEFKFTKTEISVIKVCSVNSCSEIESTSISNKYLKSSTSQNFLEKSSEGLRLQRMVCDDFSSFTAYRYIKN